VSSFGSWGHIGKPQALTLATSLFFHHHHFQTLLRLPLTCVIATRTSTIHSRCFSCCACPTTKSARDECFLVSGLDPTSPEGQDRCKDFVERHRECMRGYGFKV
jgi:hypothetical protein